jgi:hypothetical protein
MLLLRVDQHQHADWDCLTFVGKLICNILYNICVGPQWHRSGVSVALSSEQAPFISEIVASIFPTDSCEKCLSSFYRKSWVFSGLSSFLPQGKLRGWIRITQLELQYHNCCKDKLSKLSISSTGKHNTWCNRSLKCVKPRRVMGSDPNNDNVCMKL